MIKSDESTGQQSDTSHVGASTQLKRCLQVVTQTLMDIEVSQMLSANLYERSDTRRAYRNGYRRSIWNTPIGNIELQIPKLRRGTYYPDRLLNDEQVSQQLLQLIRQSMTHGVQPNVLADGLSSLGLMTLSPYELHQICDALYLTIDQFQRQDVAKPNVIERSNSRMQSSGQQNKDESFWKDFSRRMAHAGLDVEDSQSVLSGVNPYARVEQDTPKLRHPKIVRFIDIRHVHEDLQVA